MRAVILVLGALAVTATTAAAMAEKLPPAATGKIDFVRQIQPILKQHCAKCHAGEIRKGGFSINTRRTVLDGSEADVAVILGNSAQSPLILRVASADPDLRMPPKGEKPLSKKQVGLLRAWIDRGMKWPANVIFGRLHRQAPLEPRKVILPVATGGGNPIDRLLQSHFRRHGVGPVRTVSDRVFARRVWLDLIGLLPPVTALEEFAKDARPDKYDRLVNRLLSDRRAYADHWMSFWSDLLRNDYRGTGYIDGGRKQITGWLYRALYENRAYDRFVRELVTGANGAEGFIHGIKWRGTVNDSQRREMQAAQNVAQVFLGTNLKCASCHDSFVNHWKLKQAYAFASIFAEKPLQLHRCNKPLGKISSIAFLYPQLGKIDPSADQRTRVRRLAQIMTSKRNGRFSRTIVNRLWSRFFGAGIVEPLDDMDQKPWNQDLLDWLADDLATNGYDLNRTMKLICTSRTYRLASVDPAISKQQPNPVFRGPLVRRMSAEQFVDAVSTLTGVWPKPTARMRKRDGRGQGGQLSAISSVLGSNRSTQLRAVLSDTGPLLKAMGRPVREQVVTRRQQIATTLQCLELTNGVKLDSQLKAGAKVWMSQYGGKPDALIRQIYLTAFSRIPSARERQAGRDILGRTPSENDVHDFLWIITMLPEFQLVR
ncbi:MAG: DUF1549 domain-containing protein [Planctomycetes bacterium]|nr:DUF1549 domain-containing protein [Planctomycetota bacterium]